MLKTRIIPTLLFKGVGLVKGKSFDSWRRVGAALQSIRVYNLREVDELIFLDIAATPGGKRPDFREIDELADNCFMPMTVGGGVKSIEDIRDLLAVGADKVAINTAAVETPELDPRRRARVRRAVHRRLDRREARGRRHARGRDPLRPDRHGTRSGRNGRSRPRASAPARSCSPRSSATAP